MRRGRQVLFEEAALTGGAGWGPRVAFPPDREEPSMRRALRRPVSIALGVLGLFTVVTGVWNFFPPFDTEFSRGHAVGACAFGVVGIVHAWLNWNAILRHFGGLGWWRWVLLGATVIGLLALLVIPALRALR